LIPTVYLLSLPWLSSVDFAHEVCEEGECGDESVSHYILSPQATGALAGTFYFPLLLLWESPVHTSMDKWLESRAFASLFGFTLSV